MRVGEARRWIAGLEILGMRFGLERMNALLDQGMRPYQFTYEHVVEAPDDVVATTRSALLACR